MSNKLASKHQHKVEVWKKINHKLEKMVYPQVHTLGEC